MVGHHVRWPSAVHNVKCVHLLIQVVVHVEIIMIIECVHVVHRIHHIHIVGAINKIHVGHYIEICPGVVTLRLAVSEEMVGVHRVVVVCTAEGCPGARAHA